MNILLLFFALPIAVFIISIALQKIFNSTLLTSSIIFAIFLVATFVVGDLNILVVSIIYTIIALITSILTNIIERILNKITNEENSIYKNRSSCRCRRYRYMR